MKGDAECLASARKTYRQNSAGKSKARSTARAWGHYWAVFTVEIEIVEIHWSLRGDSPLMVHWNQPSPIRAQEAIGDPERE
jgi:hypothetical protein